MIKLGVDPFTTGEYYLDRNILTSVIELGDVNWFKKFVQEFKFDINNINTSGASAFKVAATFFSIEILNWLLENNNISELCVQKELTRLCTKHHLMTQKKAIELAKILIKYGAKVQVTILKGIVVTTLMGEALSLVGPNHPFFQFLKEECDKVDKACKEMQDEDILVKATKEIHEANSIVEATKEIQEIKNKNIALTAEVADLKAENEQLKAKLKEFDELYTTIANTLRNKKDKINPY